MCRKRGKGLRLATSNDKNMTTILACISASGVHMPPHILYKGKRRQYSWMIGGPKDTTTESGWMEGSNFLKWFSYVFVPYVEHLDGHKILFLDGHSSHISLSLRLEKIK